MSKKWKDWPDEDRGWNAKSPPETDTDKGPENFTEAQDQASKPNPGHTTGHAYGGGNVPDAGSFIGLSRGDGHNTQESQTFCGGPGIPIAAAPGPVPGQTGEWSIDYGFRRAGPYEPPRVGADERAREAIDAYAGIKADPHASLVRRPDHYARWKIEPITFIMANRMEYWRGAIIKYAARAGYKGIDGKTVVEAEIIDLKKAMRYCEMRINELEGKEVL